MDLSKGLLALSILLIFIGWWGPPSASNVLSHLTTLYEFLDLSLELITVVSIMAMVTMKTTILNWIFLVWGGLQFYWPAEDMLYRGVEWCKGLQFSLGYGTETVLDKDSLCPLSLVLCVLLVLAGLLPFLPFSGGLTSSSFRDILDVHVLLCP